MLTQKQINEYLNHEGARCPYCQRKDLEGYDGFDADGNWITAKIECHSCHKTWKDIYTLSGILED